MTTPSIDKDFSPFKPRNHKIARDSVLTNLFIHARNTSNIGDLISSPFNYFTVPGDSIISDFWTSVNNGVDDFDNIIVGGGGFGKFVREPMYYKRLRPRRNLILWGTFTDAHTLPPMPKAFTDKCTLIGTRDFNSASIDDEKIVFCPCASAMNRAFELPRNPSKEKVIFFMHRIKLNPFRDLGENYPVMDNYQEFTDVLNFIASGEVVVTNSYHGLYWSTLLGKKVICLEKKGKFSQFKWQPTYANPSECMDILKNIDNLTYYPSALVEARELNMKFYSKVLDLLSF